MSLDELDLEQQAPDHDDGAVRQLVDAVVRVIDRYQKEKAERISPAWVATQAMIQIRFPRTLHEIGYVGCHLEMRQIARQKLRRWFDPNEKVKASVDGEDDLFPETLQDRYPIPAGKGKEPVYVLRNLLRKPQVKFNVERMRRGGRALMRHAD